MYKKNALKKCPKKQFTDFFLMLSIKVLKSKLFPMQNHTTQRSKENITEFLIT